MTRLIANDAAGGIRWNKPDAIESAYIEFATADDSVIATVVALDKDGNELTRFSHPTLAQPDLAAFAAAAKGSEARHAVEAGDHILVSSPDRKSTRLNSSHNSASRMPSSARTNHNQQTTTT